MNQKISVVVTILNEAQTIERLLVALADQTLLPDEVIIVDGGSRDQTLLKVAEFAKTSAAKKIDWQILEKKGNRSIGRNTGIAQAQHQLIAITDAGCIPQSDWLAELLKTAEPHLQPKQGQLQPLVVAGYYSSTATTAFEEAVIPYVLVMPDKVNPKDFLPATRSMLLTKSAWEKAGHFDEKLSDNEDYAFAHALRNSEVPIFFSFKAQVTWIPRSTLQEFSWMIFRFARGDVFAGILRKKVLFLFMRYILAVMFLVLGAVTGRFSLIFSLEFVGFVLYLIWAIWKNYRYTPRGWYWLPILQLTADLAVIAGSIAGWRQKRV